MAVAVDEKKTPERAVNNEQIAWKISYKIIMKTFVSIAYSDTDSFAIVVSRRQRLNTLENRQCGT